MENLDSPLDSKLALLVEAQIIFLGFVPRIRTFAVDMGAYYGIQHCTSVGKHGQGLHPLHLLQLLLYA
jgi:hypothetical protein